MLNTISSATRGVLLASMIASGRVRTPSLGLTAVPASVTTMTAGTLRSSSASTDRGVYRRRRVVMTFFRSARLLVQNLRASHFLMFHQLIRHLLVNEQQRQTTPAAG